MLAVVLAAPEIVVDHDLAKETALARELEEGIATAESWGGSGIFTLTVSPALWSLEFNWYFLLQENGRRHTEHIAHIAACIRSVCGDFQHLRPLCPPGHSWIEDWPSIQDAVIASIACHPDLSWAWEELACWRADLHYWMQRLPRWGRMLVILRAKGKSERDIVRITGWTRHAVRTRLKWLSWFLRHAADSKWTMSQSEDHLARGESAIDAPIRTESVLSGVSYAPDSTIREPYASKPTGEAVDSIALPEVASATAGRIYARLAVATEGAEASKR